MEQVTKTFGEFITEKKKAKLDYDAADVNKDGKVDKTDSYLKHRHDVIAKAIAKEKEKKSGKKAPKKEAKATNEDAQTQTEEMPVDVQAQIDVDMPQAEAQVEMSEEEFFNMVQKLVQHELEESEIEGEETEEGENGLTIDELEAMLDYLASREEEAQDEEGEEIEGQDGAQAQGELPVQEVAPEGDNTPVE